MDGIPIERCFIFAILPAHLVLITVNLVWCDLIILICGFELHKHNPLQVNRFTYLWRATSLSNLFIITLQSQRFRYLLCETMRTELLHTASYKLVLVGWADVPQQCYNYNTCPNFLLKTNCISQTECLSLSAYTMWSLLCYTSMPRDPRHGHSPRPSLNAK